jgi:hypothetical protein
VIKYIFNERQKMKAESNPMQQVYKLVMKSAYGKNNRKPSEKSVIYCDTAQMKVKLRTLYHLITSVDHISDNLHRIEYYVEIDRSFNRVHSGSSILSMSKRIMNEVIHAMNDVGVEPFYTDTDSLHVPTESIPRIRQRFSEIYERELDGEEMGQFNSDFTPLVEGGSTPYAVKSIFLGKKSYIDQLEDDAGNTGLHFRMKRIAASVVHAHAKRDFGGDVMKLYEHLVENAYEFDEKLDDATCTFRTKRDHSIVTPEDSRITVDFAKRSRLE